MTAFSSETIDKVWQKARGMTEPSAEIWRRDECGAWIKRDQYGHEQSEFGWRIENVLARRARYARKPACLASRKHL